MKELFAWEEMLAREPGRPPDDEGPTPFDRPLRKAVARYKQKHGRPPTHLAIRSEDFLGLTVATDILPNGHFFLYEDESETVD